MPWDQLPPNQLHQINLAWDQLLRDQLNFFSIFFLGGVDSVNCIPLHVLMYYKKISWSPVRCLVVGARAIHLVIVPLPHLKLTTHPCACEVVHYSSSTLAIWGASCPSQAVGTNAGGQNCHLLHKGWVLRVAIIVSEPTSLPCCLHEMVVASMVSHKT